MFRICSVHTSSRPAALPFFICFKPFKFAHGKWVVDDGFIVRWCRDNLSFLNFVRISHFSPVHGISNYKTMRKRLERFGEIGIVAERNGLGLKFVEKTQSRFWILLYMKFFEQN